MRTKATETIGMMINSESRPNQRLENEPLPGFVFFAPVQHAHFCIFVCTSSYQDKATEAAGTETVDSLTPRTVFR